MPYNKILLLNLIPNTIGDNLLLTPFISILKKNYPHAKIDLTVSKLNKEIFINNFALNSLHEIEELKLISERNRNKLSKFLIYLNIIKRYSNQFKREKYDLCLLLLPNFPLNILIPKFAGIKEIIGYTYKYSFLSIFLDKKTAYRGFYETKEYERHFVESYLDLLREMGLKWGKKDVICKLYLTKDEKKKTKELLKKHNLKNYIAFQAGGKQNTWDINNFVKLAKLILEKKEVDIVLLGTSEEYDANQKISEQSKRIINLAGKITLRETMGIFENSQLSICNDSGLAHISSAMGTKTIVLYGWHSPNHSIPLGNGKIYPIYKYDKPFKYVPRGSKEGLTRINLIKPEDIMDIAKELL